MQHYSNPKRQRLYRLLLISAVLLAIGCLYALICHVIGFGIPCVFYTVTGLQCPGCGISRMFICLLQGDLKGAWSYNPAIMCLLLPGIAVAADVAVRYVREGTKKTHKWATVLTCGMIIILLIFGIWRNI